MLEKMMMLLGATKSILPYAVEYAKYILYAAPVMMASFVLNNLLRAEGKTKLAMTGIGIGVSLSVGGSTGGTDIIAMLVTKYHNVSPGRVLMVCDFCVIAMTLLIYDHVDREAFGGLIYGYVMMGIVSFTVDYVLTGKTQSAQLFIFTDKYDEVARELTNQVHRGVTLIDAKGWYTGQDKKIILIVARKHEASDVLRIAKQIDPDVFMTMAPVMGVFGKGFEEVKGVK